MRKLICIPLLFIGVVAMAQTRTLDDYLKLGEDHSPLLRDDQNQAAVALLENQKVRANYRLPTAYSNINWMEAPTNTALGYDAAITNGAWYAAMVGMSIPLFTKFFTERETTMHSLEADNATWQGRTALHALRKQITDAYLTCFADQALTENARQQLDLVTQQYVLSQRLAQQGIFKASDILLLKIEVEHQQMQMQSFIAQFKNDLGSLNTLCAITDTTNYALSDPHLIFTDTIVQQSNYLRQFLLDSMMTQSQQLLFELKYKPQVSAFTDAGLNTSTLHAPYNHIGFSFGVNFSVPLYDGGQRDINRQQTEIKFNTGTAYRNYFTDQRTQQLENFHTQITLAEGRIKNLEQQLTEYTSVLNLYKDALNSGEISIMDYLVVFRNALQAQQDVIYQQLQKNMAINAFNYWNW
jgi:outer membrane protein TolC